MQDERKAKMNEYVFPEGSGYGKEVEPPFPWLLVFGLILTILGIVGMCFADPTTAPVNNIVRVYVDSKIGSPCGTGFILEKGRLVTARHVILAAKKQLIIEYSNGVIEKIKKEKFRVSDKYDIAEAKIKKDKAKKKIMLSKSGHYIGKRIYTTGYPSIWGILTVTIGVVSSEVVNFPVLDSENPLLLKVFLSDVDIVGGNSGSPVFDYKDELVGIAVAKYRCISIIVSTEALKEFLNDQEKKN